MQLPLLIDRKDPMGAIDRINFEDHLPKLSGHVTVELIDNDGNVAHREEGHNFIALGGYEVLKRVMRGALCSKCPNTSKQVVNTAPNSVSYSNSVNNPFFTMVLLTDDTSAESPSTEETWAGNVIGWATINSAYSGADLKGGTISTTLSRGHDGSAKFVWEFANDRANGTFRSICLVRTSGYTDADKYTRLQPKTTFVAGGFARAYNLITEGDGYYWGSIGTNLVWKINKTTLQEIAQYTLPNTPSYVSIMYDSGYIYFWYSQRFYRYNVSTGVTDTSASISNRLDVYGESSSSHIFNGYIWWMIRATGRVCRLALSTFTTVGEEYKTISPAFTGYITYWQFIYNGNFCFFGYRSAEFGARNVCYRMVWSTGAVERETDIHWGDTEGSIGFGRMYMIGNEVHVLTGYNLQGVVGNDTPAINLIKIANISEQIGGIMSSRKLLATPVTKTSAYKMRISYELQYA